MNTPTVSTEQLLVNHASLLGVELLGVVETLRGRLSDLGPVVDSDLVPISQLIQKHTKLSLTAEVMAGVDNAGMAVGDTIGHSGVSGDLQEFGALSGKYTAFEDKLLKGTIDLKNVKVGGAFTTIPFILYIGDKTLLDSTYTAEEVTALILHEVGHAFWSLATIGEYVWMNYFLTDGIDVLLGNKPNTYRVEVLDAGYLEKHVSDEGLKAQLKQRPSEAQLRRAVLDVSYNYARGHLHSVTNPGSYKRHEQMADWFAARMGFAKPMATRLHKSLRGASRGRHYRSRPRMLAVEVMKLLFGSAAFAGLAATPLSLVFLALYAYWELTEHSDPQEYDKPKARIEKLRLEMVAQLKDVTATPAQRKRLQGDIKTLDGLLKTMSEHMTVWESLAHLTRPTKRRTTQLLKQEQELERLLNNDLFVHADRFRS